MCGLVSFWRGVTRKESVFYFGFGYAKVEISNFVDDPIMIPNFLIQSMHLSPSKSCS